MTTDIVVETKELTEAKKTARSLYQEAVKLEVVDEASAKYVSEILTDVKITSKSFEAQRKFFVKPLNDQVDKINDLFKTYTKGFGMIEDILNPKLLAYHAVQQELQAKAQAKIEAETAKVQAQLNKQAKKEGVEAPQVNVPVVAQAPNKIGNTSVRKTWTFKVVKESLVPREYMMIDEKKVDAAIREGERKIKGLEIFQKYGLSTRTK